MEIISKRHPYKFYFRLIALLAFVLGAGCIFLFASMTGVNLVGFIFFILFTLIAAGIYYVFTKNAPKVILNQKGIIYKGDFYSWDKISDIKLTGKGDLFLGVLSESTSFTVDGAKRIHVFDEFYANAPQMKCFIEDFIINKNKIRNKPEVSSPPDFGNEKFIAYKGNPFLCFSGIMMWGMVLFVVLMPIFSHKEIDPDRYQVLLGFGFIWFLIYASLMNYFEISEHYFVVKNHYFFWKKDRFLLSDIKQIAYEQRGRQPYSLRLITNRYQSKSYFAASLWGKTWRKMQQDLQKKNIAVSNPYIH